MYQLGFDFQAVPPTLAPEQIGFRNTLRRQNELLFLLGQIAREIIDAVRKQPDASVLDVDVGEDRCPREIGLLRLRSLIRVWCKRTDVNHAHNAIVGSSAGDHASTVRVANEDNRVADPPRSLLLLRRRPLSLS